MKNSWIMNTRDYNKSRWTLHDELNFIRSLANSYRSHGKSGEEMLPSLCEDYGLDVDQCLGGYLVSLHLRKDWSGIDPDMVYLLREEAEKQLRLWRGDADINTKDR